MDYRTQQFRIKFDSASKALGAAPHEIVSLKVREMVNSYEEYRQFMHELERENGVQVAPLDGEFQGRGYVLTQGSSRTILVEHETGLEILSVASSIASLISLVPLILQGWRAFRNYRLRHHDADFHEVEVRRVDGAGNLSEEHVHADRLLAGGPHGGRDTVLAAVGAVIEAELKRLGTRLDDLTRRVEALEKKPAPKQRKRTPAPKKKRA